jgi:Trk K+ transport system NAD-binding subunit
MWMYGHILKLKERDKFPKGRYIIYGSGRMGKAIAEGLKEADVEYELKSFDSKKYIEERDTAIFGDEEDMQNLIASGVKTSACIIAATKNDILNLTILNSAKQLNPHIFTMARENSLDDLNIFQAAKINKIYVVEKILADSTYNFISRPLVDIFIREARKQTEEWAEIIVNVLNNITGMNPKYFETQFNNENSYALSLELEKGENVTLANLRRSRENKDEMLQIVFLLLKRGEEIFLMPDSQMSLEMDDELLSVSDEDVYEDFEYIVNNIYELNYVLDRDETNNLSYFKSWRKDGKNNNA